MRLTLALFLTFTAPTALAQDCPAPGTQLSLAEQQFVSFNTVGVDEYLAQAIGEFGCSGATTTDEVGLIVAGDTGVLGGATVVGTYRGPGGSGLGLTVIGVLPKGKQVSVSPTGSTSLDAGRPS